jgi:DNA-binding GntR family transcriptional regulator
MSGLLQFEDASSTFTVYREIKRRIVDLQYGIGERLSEALLAEDLGVGRSPIRMALWRLELGGWVAISPHSGTYIKAMTIREVREVADL